MILKLKSWSNILQFIKVKFLRETELSTWKV